MNLAIDLGNTAVKWAVFESDKCMQSGVWNIQDGVRKIQNVDCAMACVSGDNKLLGQIEESLGVTVGLFSADRPLPIKIDYKTPATLGADRLAAACGAWALHHGEDCLIIDAGTCITVDFLSADGVYHGGAIMPGLEMNLRALHTFTAKLPLISLDGVTKAPVLGRSTEESILSGTLGATMLALAGYVALYRQKSPSLHVLLTGGASSILTAAGASGWELQPLLTLTGLNAIMLAEK